jgi:hypothetical protein
MAITTAMTTTFKKELLEAKHNFLATGGNTFKIALIKASEAGTYGTGSTNYSDITGNSDEASGTGYSAGGNTLTNVDPATSGTTAYTDFPDTSWSGATISTNGCMIYNSTNSNRAVSVHSFGGTQTVTAGTLTLVFPTPDATNAIIRIA